MRSLLDILAIIGAKYLFLASLFVGGIFFLKARRDVQKKIVIASLLAVPLILLAAFIANHSYDNPRPFVILHFTPLIPHSPDNGFPSDHVLLASAIAMVLGLFGRRIGVILWSIPILIAFSRVYVGVHHPLDVIASMLIAIVVTILVREGIRRRSPRFFN